MHPYTSEVLDMLGRFAAGWRARRQQARTEWLINRLPPQIRKDIGWPEGRPSFPSARTRNPLRP